MSERTESTRGPASAPTTERATVSSVVASSASSAPKRTAAHASEAASADHRGALAACFRARFEQAVYFREDAVLGSELASEAMPVLAALDDALASDGAARALHESYALTTLLARRAALLGATPSAALALVTALIAALSEIAGRSVDDALRRELAIVAVEGYCAARDERVASDLLAAAASAQVAVPLGPGCLAIFLAGCHDERNLAPVLDRCARRLLHEDVRSCLLDLSRLRDIDGADDALARVVANFCASAATLGVSLTVVGASASLRGRFALWLPVRDPPRYVDDYVRGQALALAQAGLAVKSRWDWQRVRRALVRGSTR